MLKEFHCTPPLCNAVVYCKSTTAGCPAVWRCEAAIPLPSAPPPPPAALWRFIEDVPLSTAPPPPPGSPAAWRCFAWVPPPTALSQCGSVL